MGMCGEREVLVSQSSSAFQVDSTEGSGAGGELLGWAEYRTDEQTSAATKPRRGDGFMTCRQYWTFHTSSTVLGNYPIMLFFYFLFSFLTF